MNVILNLSTPSVESSAHMSLPRFRYPVVFDSLPQSNDNGPINELIAERFDLP